MSTCSETERCRWILDSCAEGSGLRGSRTKNPNMHALSPRYRLQGTPGVHEGWTMAPPPPPPGRQELAAVVRFHLVPTNETLKLAERAPQLGASWTSPTEQPSHRRSRRSDSDSASPSVLPTVLPWQEFTDSDWRPLQHVLIHALARHPARSGQSEAQFCIVAAPPQPGLYPKGHAERRAGGTSAGNNGGCGSVGNRWSDWIALCPALPIIVIDTVQAVHGFLEAWALPARADHSFTSSCRQPSTHQAPRREA